MSGSTFAQTEGVECDGLRPAVVGLADRRSHDLVDDDQIAGHLVAGHVLTTVGGEYFEDDDRALHRCDDGADALAEPVGAMVDSVITCLGQAPPELAQDLITQGLYLVGGGSMLRGLDRRLALETEVPVRQVAEPLETVVLGAGRVIESYEALQAMFMDAR